MRNLCFGLILLSIISTSPAIAAERKPFEQVKVDELAKDLQVTQLDDNRHFSLVWWVPAEYWRVALAKQPSIHSDDVKDFLEPLQPYSCLGIVQADISRFGVYTFYGKRHVEDNSTITFIDSAGTQRSLEAIRLPGSDVEMLINQFKPIFQAALGRMGENFHFLILENVSEDDKRIVDPYEEGTIVVEMAKSDSSAITAELQLPVNALFIPRKCPNGRDAHVSWKYCPWTGKELEE